MTLKDKLIAPFLCAEFSPLYKQATSGNDQTKRMSPVYQ